MPDDLTIPQGSPERRQSREMSLKRGRPPTQVAGYEPERFLGMGAYGEVWVAVQANTGRRVAIKFYAHRGGLDWSLLSREVEKLAFLFADRYVVQLIGVGWDAEPPYYIMEYLEQGSLAERIEDGPLEIEQAVSLFHDVAVGLVHAHGKGVLHCDLKPANILLDQDGKPRLADFGQSRLSHEQAPALGTLFYMAPEQADLEAVPDARWDVYALGAVLYCMLTGRPPYRDAADGEKLESSGDLTDRLARYRRMLRRAPRPRAHREVPGVDSDLAEIIDRCLAIDPHKRFANAQAVIDALSARAARIARRPMMLFGTVGPVLLLLLVLGLVWLGSSRLMGTSEEDLVDRTLRNTDFAAQFGGRGLESALERRFTAVEALAAAKPLRTAVVEMTQNPELTAMLEELADPKTPKERIAALREEFLHAEARQPLQEALSLMQQYSRLPKTSGSGWFLTDARGVQIARLPEGPGKNTIGKNFAWRTYFHGKSRDMAPSERPEQGTHVKRTELSAFYKSKATMRWVTAISAPVYDSDGPERKFLGVLAVMVDANEFEELKLPRDDESGVSQQFYVIVDQREGDNKGRIVQHDLYDQLIAQSEAEREKREKKKEEEEGDEDGEEKEGVGLPERFFDTVENEKTGEHEPRYALKPLPENREQKGSYHDPLGDDPAGAAYRGRWLASAWPVVLNQGGDKEGRDTGLVVLAQTNYETTIGDAVDDLGRGLFQFGLLATASMLAVIAGLWAMAYRLMNGPGFTRRGYASGDPSSQRPSGSMTPGSVRSRMTPSDPNAPTEPLPRVEEKDEKRRTNDESQMTKE